MINQRKDTVIEPNRFCSCVLVLVCFITGCGGVGDPRHALVIGDEWSGVCTDYGFFDKQNSANWFFPHEMCVAYKANVKDGTLSATAELDPNHAYYDVHRFRYGPKRRQELVFRLDTPRGAGAWQKISVDASSCVRLHAYLWPGVNYENADLQRRLVNFEGLHRIVQRLDQGEIQVYRQGVNARRYAQALRNLATRSSDQGLVGAYTAYADAISERIAVGVMERGFFLKRTVRRFLQPFLRCPWRSKKP